MSGSELDQERARASFPTRQLTYFLDGGHEKTEKKERIRKLVEEDPVFEKKSKYFMNHTESYKKALQKIHRIETRKRELKLEGDDLRLFKNYAVDYFPTVLHDQVFVPNLMGQMSPEQQQKWVKKALNYEIIGCYAQTELGHGSNVRGLETLATFIKETDEFEIHSPTLTSIKWWPGGMAKTANFAVVYARLVLPDGDYGVHPFLVQLRSLEDHKLLPGIISGDIGPKFGSQYNDNGYLRFTKVRIPRENMLMKHSKVTHEGLYSTPPHSKLSYGTMVIVRAGLVVSAFSALAQASTIAVRYGCVRKQGYDQKGEETKILDYRMQQYRLLPLVATAYALQFTGRYMLQVFDNMQKGMESGDLTALPEVHATSSGLKSLTTRLAADGIEECRKACGGHGYLLSSGLPTLFTDYVQSCTVEGDNYLLTQQTTRYLWKAYQQGREGKKLAGNTKYLERVDQELARKCNVKHVEGFLSNEFQLEAYRHRAALSIHQTASVISNEMGKGKDFDLAWNNALVEVYRASKAHCFLTILVSFISVVENARKSKPELATVLKRLQDLFALYWIEENLGEFTEDGYLNSQQIAMLRAQVRHLLDLIRPDAVALVDAFNFSDFELNSALGRYDGKVYESLLEMAQMEPINKEEVTQGYEQYLRPMFKKEGIFKSSL